MIEWFLDLAWYWEALICFGLFLISQILFVLITCISWDLTWALLRPVEEMPTETLKLKHTDWWPFLKWIPRRVTAFLNGPNSRRIYPRQLLGSNNRILHSADKWLPVHHLGEPVIQTDVPEPGTWSLTWPLHFAMQTKGGFLFGIGFRCDYYGRHWIYPRLVCRKN